MVETLPSFICTKADCAAPDTGLCAEGHKPIDSCPFYRQAERAADGSTQVEAVLDQTGDLGILERVDLPSGKSLTPAAVDAFLRWRPAIFVTIVGDLNSGKTTLICSIYDRFLRGPFANYLFTGSRTLFGFERWSHRSREASGGVKPDTEHTSRREELRFFHFAVSRSDRLDSRRDIMLSDRAGEIYRETRDHPEKVEELREVYIADRLVLLLDGSRIADPVERAEAMQSVRQTLRAFLDGGALHASSVVQVVTTKIDLLNKLEDKPAIDTLLADFQRRLDSDFGPRVGRLAFFSVSARDPDGQLAPAFGVDALFSDWAEASSHTATPSKAESVVLHSEFDRLLLRTPTEVPG